MSGVTPFLSAMFTSAPFSISILMISGPRMLMNPQANTISGGFGSSLDESSSHYLSSAPNATRAGLPLRNQPPHVLDLILQNGVNELLL